MQNVTTFKWLTENLEYRGVSPGLRGRPCRLDSRGDKDVPH